MFVKTLIFKKGTTFPSDEMSRSLSETLNMLGLYLYTFVSGHTLCSMLSIHNELTLQKELQHFM